MGLFDKKKKGGDDFDSPVEEISLAAKPSSGASPGPGGKPTDTVPGSLTAVGAKKPAPPPEPEPDLHFNIDKAIELMRQLPQDNVEWSWGGETTLESMRTRSPRSSTTRPTQQHIEQRIAGRKKEIAISNRNTPSASRRSASSRPITRASMVKGPLSSTKSRPGPLLLRPSCRSPRRALRRRYVSLHMVVVTGPNRAQAGGQAESHRTGASADFVHRRNGIAPTCGSTWPSSTRAAATLRRHGQGHPAVRAHRLHHPGRLAGLEAPPRG